MSINLKKGETAEMPKSNCIYIGLGWDTKCDLDAHADIIKSGMFFKRKSEHIYYGNFVSNDGSVVHHGDNLTGIGKGDDEVIKIKLDKISGNVKRIDFSVHIYSGAVSFSSVEGAYIRAVDGRTNTEICKYNLSTSKLKERTYNFGSLIKTNKDWIFKADK